MIKQWIASEHTYRLTFKLPRTFVTLASPALLLLNPYRIHD